MPIQELHHTAGRRNEGDISVTWGSLQQITHEGRTVIFMQARPGGGRRKPYAIIPGYKVGEYEHTGKTTSVKVETIPRSDQPVIKEKIQSITEGPISFW